MIGGPIARIPSRNVQLAVPGNSQPHTRGIPSQMVSIPNQSYEQTQTSRSHSNHEVIDINLNINVNVGNKSKTYQQDGVVEQVLTPRVPPSPTYVVNRQPPTNRFLMAPPRPQMVQRVAPQIRAFPVQYRVQSPQVNHTRVNQSAYPVPSAVMTNVRLPSPPKEKSGTIIANRPATIIEETIEEAVPMVSSYPPAVLQPQEDAEKVGCYIPSSIIEDSDIITCVICKEKYRIRDKERHSNKHRKSIGLSTAHMSHTIVDTLERDIRLSENTESQYQRLTYQRQRVRELFEADSLKMTIPQSHIFSSGQMEQNPNMNFRYVDSVAIRGSQDVILPQREESHRIPQPMTLNPSFLGPYAESQERIPSRIPSFIPGQAPESFVRDKQPNGNFFHRGALAEIPSVISEKNSMGDSSNANPNSPGRRTQQTSNPTSLNAASSGAFVSSFVP